MPRRGRSVLFMARRLLSKQKSWKPSHSTRLRGSALSDNALQVGRTSPRRVKNCIGLAALPRDPCFTGLRGARPRKESGAMDDGDPVARGSREVLRMLQGRRMGLAAALLVAAG